MRKSCGKKTKGAGTCKQIEWWKDGKFVHRIRNLEKIPRRQPSRRSASRPSIDYAEECTDEGIPISKTITMVQNCPRYAFVPISEPSQPSLPTPAPEELSNHEIHSMTKACEEILKDSETSGMPETEQGDCTLENFVLNPKVSEYLRTLPYLDEQWKLMNSSWRNPRQNEEHDFAYCAEIGAIFGC